ncbi:unnamed protein product [Choristocarpus tenellus]
MKVALVMSVSQRNVLYLCFTPLMRSDIVPTGSLGWSFKHTISRTTQEDALRVQILVRALYALTSFHRFPVYPNAFDFLIPCLFLCIGAGGRWTSRRMWWCPTSSEGAGLRQMVMTGTFTGQMCTV